MSELPMLTRITAVCNIQSWLARVGCAIADPDTRRLERSSVQRNVEDFCLGGAVLHIPHDVRKLRPL